MKSPNQICLFSYTPATKFQSIQGSPCLFVYLSVCSYVYVSICVCLSVCLSLSLSVHVLLKHNFTFMKFYVMVRHHMKKSMEQNTYCFQDMFCNGDNHTLSVICKQDYYPVSSLTVQDLYVPNYTLNRNCIHCHLFNFPYYHISLYTGSQLTRFMNTPFSKL